MSQQQARETIETYFEAFNASDYDRLLSLLDEDVVHDINQGNREIGREKFSWFLARMRQHYDERIDDLVIMTTPDGSRAAAEYTLRGTYLVTAEDQPPASGQTYSIAAGVFFDFDDGRISRITACCNLRAWVRQIEEDADG